MSLTPEAIVAIIGVLVGTPPTFALLYTVYRRRAGRGTHRERPQSHLCHNSH